MTAVEMQYNFELKLGTIHHVDKIFTSADISSFLSKAQEDFIESRLPSRNNRTVGVSYIERDEKTRTELSPLIQSYVATGANLMEDEYELHDNSILAILPSDYYYSLKEHCKLSYEDCNGDQESKLCKVVPIRHDEYESNIKNPFGKPFKDLVWRLDYGVAGGKYHELISGGDNVISEYYLRYLKFPYPINVVDESDCELHESTHEEIIDRAVLIAVNSIPKINNVEQKQEV